MTFIGGEDVKEEEEDYPVRYLLYTVGVLMAMFLIGISVIYLFF